VHFVSFQKDVEEASKPLFYGRNSHTNNQPIEVRVGEVEEDHGELIEFKRYTILDPLLLNSIVCLSTRTVPALGFILPYLLTIPRMHHDNTLLCPL